MDFKQSMEKLAQVGRERQSIELAKLDLQEEMTRLAAEAPGTNEPIYPAEFGDLARRLAALVDAEQEQATMLWGLLEQAYRDLFEAREEIAKAYGDPPLPG